MNEGEGAAVRPARTRQIYPGEQSHDSWKNNADPATCRSQTEHQAAWESPCLLSGPLTWSAKDVDSMPISSRSAVSLHICSHFIFRSLSRSSRITPGQQHRVEEKGGKKKPKTTVREGELGRPIRVFRRTHQSSTPGSGRYSV